MTFTLQAIARSLANYLAPHFNGVAFYEDPNQQGSGIPCMFLQQRSGKSDERLSGYCQRDIRLDLTYLEDYNLPDLHRRYLAAAEKLDELMKIIPYAHGKETALLHTYRREWRIDLDGLHYNFELRVRNYVPAPKRPMMKMNLEEQVNYGEQARERAGKA